VDKVAPRSRRWLHAWLPVLIWAAILFGLSSIPGAKIPNVRISYADKIVHGGLYGILGFLCFRGSLRTNKLGPGAAVLIAVSVALGYGLSDEVHQLFVPQRSFDLLDLAADVAGGSAGALGGWLSGVGRAG
jgi:VanZ family protein